MRTFVLAAVAAVTISVPASAAAPDLVGDFNTSTGVVAVKNIGNLAARKTVVTLKCVRRDPPVVGGGGGCPEIPRTYISTYSNPAFPDSVAVNVPDLAPGAVFTHALPFFGALVFPPGSYAFTVKADAGATEAESNETNNVVVKTKTVP